MRLRLVVLATASLLLTATSPLFGQDAKPEPLPQKPKDNRSGYERSARATLLHVANVYAIADPGTPTITTVTPGHEVVIAAHNGDWVNVFANTDVSAADEDDDNAPEITDPKAEKPQLTGWIRDKGVVTPTTPHGDQILFGAALDFEAQAQQPHAPKASADAARLLYRRVADYFPASTLAAEALFRSADIRWQLEKSANSDLPSAHEQESYLRPQLYEGEFKRLIKRYPQSDQAARAAYDLLDNKLCGDWQGLPKCPEMETGLYMKYAEHYRGGPKTSEALYNAAYRQAVVVTMYNLDDQPKRADVAIKNCNAIVDQMRAQYPRSEYTDRAAAISYKVTQHIPVYGSDRD